MIKVFKILALTATVLLFTVNGAANARDWTGGFGHGATYNGLGVNFGLKGKESMHYVALGCVGTPGNAQPRPSVFKKESNCGFAIGSLRAIKETCCFGINVGRTATRSLGQIHLRFSYIYFFKGIKKSSLNVGMSPVLTFDTNTDTPTQYLQLNIGMQF